MVNLSAQWNVSDCQTNGIYSGWRKNCGPTLYGPNKTPVTADILEAGFFYAGAIVAFSLLLIAFGKRGFRQKLFSAIRAFVAVFVVTSLMLCNFGQEWEVAELTTHTQYRAGVRKGIEAHIGVKIGLRSVNITLKGEPSIIQKFENNVSETVNYNERFHWDSLGFVQGRNFFGPNAGIFNQEFRAAQQKGLPYPILWIAEYFTIDGEGIRWGRHYRQAGFYTHMVVWLAFPLWILSMMLFYMVLFYGGLFSIFTGISLLIGNILFATIRNVNELAIPFDEDKVLVFHWGWTFWLNLATGVICVVIGALVIVIDKCIPMCTKKENTALVNFFNIDPLQELEEVYLSQSDIQVIADKPKTRGRFNKNPGSPNSHGIIINSYGAQNFGFDGDENSNDEDGEDYENAAEIPQAQRPMFRKRTLTAGGLIRSRKKKAPKAEPRSPNQHKPDSPDSGVSSNGGNGTDIEMRGGESTLKRAQQEVFSGPFDNADVYVNQDQLESASPTKI